MSVVEWVKWVKCNINVKIVTKKTKLNKKTFTLILHFGTDQPNTVLVVTQK